MLYRVYNYIDFSLQRAVQETRALFLSFNSFVMVILLSDIMLLDFDNTDNLDTIVHHNNEEEGEFYPNLTRVYHT